MNPTTELGQRLRLFWHNVARGRAVLACLQEAATWRVACDQRYIDRRIGSRRLPSAKGTCFCCGIREASQRHHIVPIRHGGRNIARNIVHVCKPCHKRIHPWMRKPELPPALPGVADRHVSGPPRLVKAQRP